MIDTEGFVCCPGCANTRGTNRRSAPLLHLTAQVPRGPVEPDRVDFGAWCDLCSAVALQKLKDAGLLRYAPEITQAYEEGVERPFCQHGMATMACYRCKPIGIEHKRKR